MLPRRRNPVLQHGQIYFLLSITACSLLFLQETHVTVCQQHSLLVATTYQCSLCSDYKRLKMFHAFEQTTCNSPSQQVHCRKCWLQASPTPNTNIYLTKLPQIAYKFCAIKGCTNHQCQSIAVLQFLLEVQKWWTFSSSHCNWSLNHYPTYSPLGYCLLLFW